MPRKSTQKAAVDRVAAADVDNAALTSALAAHDERASALAVVEQQYSIEMPYNLDAVILRARQTAAESAARLIELGLLLIQIREHESPETFRDALDRIGVNTRFAQRTMQAAIKLQDRPRIQQLGVSKALELLAESDDTLDELEDGGTVAGLRVDEIGAMTTRELREVLRRERAERDAEKAATDEIVARKDKRINALQAEKRTLKKSGVREQVAPLLAEIDEAAVEVASILQQLRDGVSSIRAAYDEAGEAIDEDVAARIDQNLQFAANALQQLSEELGE